MNRIDQAAFCSVMSIAGLFVAFACSMCILSGCGDLEPARTEPGTVTAFINGVPWESANVTINVQDVNGEKQIRIAAIIGTTEALYLGITENESQLFGSHPITSQANGEFIAFSQPGSPSLIETHTPFNCPIVTGNLMVDEYNPQENYISGRFFGTVCEQNGGQLQITEGEFFQLNF